MHQHHVDEESARDATGKPDDLMSNGPDSEGFRRCDRCRNILSDNQPSCVICGAVSGDYLQEPETEQDLLFREAVLGRPAIATPAILGINIAIYVMMVIVAGGNYFNNLLTISDYGTLVAFGAKTNELLQAGEWFRLLTPIFIHGGLLHLALNSYAIWQVGPLVERLYGPARFLLIYLLSGIGGVVGSYIGAMRRLPYTTSVGASGAIFGLFGLLLVLIYRYRDDLPDWLRRPLKSQLPSLIIVNLVIGFVLPTIDNGGHIGGLLTGGLLAILVAYLRPGEAMLTRSGMAMITASILVFTICFSLAWLHREIPLRQRSEKVLAFAQSIEAAREVIIESIVTADASTANDGRIESTRRRLEAQLPPDPTAGKLQVLALEQLQILGQTPAKLAGTSEWKLESASRASALQSALVQWVRTEGGRYGLRLTTPEPLSPPEGSGERSRQHAID